MIQQFKRKEASECDPTNRAMHTKTNDELVEMIYDGNDKDDEALQQLIHNLIPMMLKLGRMYLGRIPIYDNDDYIQEGSILIWRKIRDRKWNPGSGRFGNFFYTAFRFRVLHMYRTYVMKNMIKINEDEDYYCYGYRICTLVVDEFAIEYREKQKERNKAWAIKSGRQKPKLEEPKKPEMTPAEKAEKERQRRREYFAKHREEINARKHQWYIENREYALRYQKAYDAGVRIGKHGMPKGGYALGKLTMHQEEPDSPEEENHVFYTIKQRKEGL